MVAYIKEMAVNGQKWLDEDTFRDGVVLCQSIPGATAMQTAAYVGLRSNGIQGAFSSFVGFGLPAFVLMLVLSSLYEKYNDIPIIISLFSGLQVIVVAIVLNAAYSFGKGTFKNYKDIILAMAAAALLWAGISPFIVIIGASLAGMVFLRSAGAVPLSAGGKQINRFRVRQLYAFLLTFLLTFISLYFIDERLFDLSALMMRIDLFAFGGGFASVPLMLHEVVDIRGWMDSTTFMDGIALGQVTPGPIVITSTFVGYLTQGIVGAFVATISIFAPSFLMVIAITPIMDRLRNSIYFHGATKGILTSFVGLLFFVTIKFASGVPWDVMRVLLACVAFAALLKKIDIVYIVLIAAFISVIIF